MSAHHIQQARNAVSAPNERQLWRIGRFTCVMISCCTGAELQVRTTPAAGDDEEILLRELYPTKSDLYERANALESEYAAGA